MTVVELHDKCDRCGHQMRQHSTALLGTRCMVGRSEMRRVVPSASLKGWRFCPCDGFVPVPR